jgi:hypothetical protein
MTKEQLEDIQDAEKDVADAERELKSAEEWLMKRKVYLAEIIIRYYQADELDKRI